MTSEHPSEEIEAIGQLLLISSSDPKKRRVYTGCWTIRRSWLKVSYEIACYTWYKCLTIYIHEENDKLINQETGAPKVVKCRMLQ